MKKSVATAPSTLTPDVGFEKVAAQPLRRPPYREARRAPLCDFPVRDEILRRFMPLSPRADVLELGPGPGYTAYWLAPQVRSVTLVDVAARTLRELEARLVNRPNIDYLHWDICTPGLPELLGATFDAVFGLDVFEYMRDANAALRNLYGVLRPGGQMLLSFPNFLPGTNDGIHCYRTPEEAVGALRGVGFQCWELFTIRLRPWAQGVFTLLHERPMALHRRLRGGASSTDNFDATWSAQNRDRWQRYAGEIHLYWHFLRGLMRASGEIYHTETEGDIVGRQLVLRAWK